MVRTFHRNGLLKIKGSLYRTVVPFATSGMSPIGDSGKLLQALVPEAKVVVGDRLSTDISEKKLADWAKEWV